MKIWGCFTTDKNVIILEKLSMFLSKINPYVYGICSPITIALSKENYRELTVL